MTTLLLDASVLLAAFDPEHDHHESARAVLEDEVSTLATLDLARYEVADVAIRAWRAPELVAPLPATIERLADDGGVVASTDTLLVKAAAEEGGSRLVSCDHRDLVSRGLAVFPTNANDEGSR